jgi:hypothetical protein
MALVASKDLWNSNKDTDNLSPGINRLRERNPDYLLPLHEGEE